MTKLDCLILHRNYRFRIYPTQAQRQRLAQWEGSARFIWNIANEQRLAGLARPRGERKFPTAFGQAREVTELRREHAWLADVPSRTVAATLDALHSAWRNRFDRSTGAPRFRRRGQAQQITLDERLTKWASGTCVVLSRLREMKIRRHRTLTGRTVRLALIREADQWFAVFTQEIEIVTPARLPGVVGVDRGVARLTADSDGKVVEGPRFAERSARKIKRLSQAVARAKKGSSNRAKARLRLARAHRKVRRQRAWLQHQISHDYAKSHGVVVIEKLETAQMTRSARGTVESPGRNVRAKAGLNRSILDAGWSRLAAKLKYKLEERGGELVEVPAAYSSQTCSACGYVDAASRHTQSEFCCVACGHSENADVNAARVIKSRWSPPVQPVEASHEAA